MPAGCAGPESGVAASARAVSSGSTRVRGGRDPPGRRPRIGPAGSSPFPRAVGQERAQQQNGVVQQDRGHDPECAESADGIADARPWRRPPRCDNWPISSDVPAAPTVNGALVMPAQRFDSSMSSASSAPTTAPEDNPTPARTCEHTDARIILRCTCCLVQVAALVVRSSSTATPGHRPAAGIGGRVRRGRDAAAWSLSYLPPSPGPPSVIAGCCCACKKITRSPRTVTIPGVQGCRGSFRGLRQLGGGYLVGVEGNVARSSSC